MAESVLIGNAKCPVCLGPGARVTLTKKQFALLTCSQGRCRVQLFVRSEESDEKVRAWIIGKPAAPAASSPAGPVAEPSPAANPAPIPAKVAEAAPVKDEWAPF